MAEQEKAQRSAEAIAADMRREAAEKAQREGTVSALLRERQGYVERADAADDDKVRERLTSRVAQVDEQLRFHDAADQIPKVKRGRPAAGASPDATA
jgi:hypothetical protein